MLINWIPEKLFANRKAHKVRSRKQSSQGIERLEGRTLLSAAPIVTLPIGTVDYTEDGAAVDIAPGATVIDVDSTDFGSGQVTASVSGNANADDRLSIRNQGNAAGQIGVAGNTVSFGGTAIGTFSGGDGTNPLTVDLLPSATPAAVSALLSNITFETVGDDPSLLPRTVQFIVDDGTPGGVSLPATRLLDVLPLNDIPLLDVTGPTVDLPSGGTGVVVSANGTVSDPDSTDFDGGTLTVDVSANGSVDDELGIRNAGTGAGQIGVAGNTVFFGGTDIGTFTGGTGLTPLVVTFNSDATPEAVQALVRNITFNTSGNVGDISTVRFALADGDGGLSVDSTRDVELAPPNVAPVIVTDSTTLQVDNGKKHRVDTTATVVDVDSADFNNGELTAHVQGAGRDRLEINRRAKRRESSAGITFQRRHTGNVLFNGQVIGSYHGGRAGENLTVQLNANATDASVQELLRNITIRARGNGTRMVEFQVTDGDGGTSNIASRTVVRS